MKATILQGDCVTVMAEIPEASFDSIVTDPPYELLSGSRNGSGRSKEPDNPFGRHGSKGGGFMGLAWDASGVAFDPETWRVAKRVLKPGGHLVAFGGTRRFHRLMCAIEDAGFEIRDCISYMFGSGFPKNLDVSKQIDTRKDWVGLRRLQAKVRETRTKLGISQSEAARRCGLIGPSETLGGGGFMWYETELRVPTHDEYAALKSGLALDDECDLAFEAAEREVTGTAEPWANRTNYAMKTRDGLRRDIPASELAEIWRGWGTALKPAWEPIILARKPLGGRNVADNVLRYGTGAINIDGCRISSEPVTINRLEQWSGFGEVKRPDYESTRTTTGRWPANVVLTHASGCRAVGTKQVRGSRVDKPAAPTPASGYGGGLADARPPRGYGNTDHVETVEAYDCEAGCPVRLLDEQSGATGATASVRGDEPSDPVRNVYGQRERVPGTFHADSGGASRFYYTSKASRSERTERLRPAGLEAIHPTVKPLDLMRWLCRLVTRPGGHILDPFAGSGTTLVAALQEGFEATGIEQSAEYIPIIQARIDGVQLGGLFDGL